MKKHTNKLNLARIIISGLMIYLCVSITQAQVFNAADHWWHGGVSVDVNDPANWTDRNAATDPTAPGSNPGGTSYNIVRIGASWASEDLNGNSTLDPGEDLNGNSVIDDDQWSSADPGYGGYYTEDGRGIDVPVDPVLSATYVSQNGDSYGGWWFVLNAPNILTLEDGAYLIMNRDNCNLRNGGRLEVQGHSDPDGPSLILSKQFRIAENGSVTDAAHEVSQLRVNGTGWVQSDPSLPSGTGAAFMIGTSDVPGTMPRGEIIIEDSGRVELKQDGLSEMFLYFGNADNSVNQIIIRDKGELWLYGDPATMGKVGTDNTLENATVVSLQNLISTQLITNDQGGSIEISGSSPTIIKATGVPSTNNTGAILTKFALDQNYPNPFNPQTTIKYEIPENGNVKLGVYNIYGQEIAVLVNDFRKTGTYSVSFNGSNIPSGIYFYRLESNGYSAFNRMLLLK